MLIKGVILFIYFLSTMTVCQAGKPKTKEPEEWEKKFCGTIKGLGIKKAKKTSSVEIDKNMKKLQKVLDKEFNSSKKSVLEKNNDENIYKIDGSASLGFHLKLDINIDELNSFLNEPQKNQAYQSNASIKKVSSTDTKEQKNFN